MTYPTPTTRRTTRNTTRDYNRLTEQGLWLKLFMELFPLPEYYTQGIAQSMFGNEIRTLRARVAVLEAIEQKARAYHAAYMVFDAVKDDFGTPIDNEYRQAKDAQTALFAALRGDDHE